MCKTQPAHARAPLFTCPSQAGPVAFTYSMFISRLKAGLGRAGVDPDNYAGHSLRRGGASFALACKGDWKSDCYQRYLDPDIQTKFFVAKAMSDKVQSLRFFNRDNFNVLLLLFCSLLIPSLGVWVIT